MIPIVPIVGKSNTGKTTFLEKLVGELKRRGYKVAVIKHDVHGFEIDQPGKDTWRLARAGSDIVAISSPDKIAVIKKTEHDMSPDEIEAQLIGGVDIVLAEGYKRSTKKKVEVFREATGRELLCQEDELIALVTDHHFPMGVPQFDLDDASGLVDLLEKSVLAPMEESEVSIAIDGRVVPVEGFAEQIVAKGIMGILSALKGVDSPSEVTVRIKV